jgi:hypothetical protein
MSTARTCFEIEDNIAANAPLVDRTPFAHNIIGLELNILQTTYGYTLDRIKKIVKRNKLDKKGWGYILKLEE